jgi:hypothetical protein
VKLTQVKPGIYRTQYGTLYIRDSAGVLWKSAGTVEQLMGTLVRRKVTLDTTWDGKARDTDPATAKIELRP